MRGSPAAGQDPHRVTVERAYAAAGRVSALRETMEVVARLQAETEAEAGGPRRAPLAALSTWLVDVVQCELVDAAVLLEELDAFTVPRPDLAPAAGRDAVPPAVVACGDEVASARSHSHNLEG